MKIVHEDSRVTDYLALLIGGKKFHYRKEGHEDAEALIKLSKIVKDVSGAVNRFLRTYGLAEDLKEFTTKSYPEPKPSQRL